MRKLWKRGLALCLVLALAVPQVFASDALGSDRKGRTVRLGAGTAVTDNSLWSATYSDLRTEHYITYQPNGTVTPIVWYGDTVVGTASMSAAAARLEAQGYRVAAGINGGFFNSDGTAVGLLFSGGVIRSMDQWNYSMVGICADGTAFIDTSNIVKTVSWTDRFGMPVSLNLTAVNKSRDNGGLYLFDQDFGPSTQNTLGGVDVVLEPVIFGQELTMNSVMTLRVVRVTDSTQEGVQADNTIPAGCFVLSANKNCADSLLDPLRALSEGMEITLTISGGDSRWADAVYGLTGLYSLVKDGQVVSGLAAGAAPRTAIGVRADGGMVLYTIDGRQSGYSIGATYTQVAQRLIELGCVDAAALDGGGSTTVGATLPGSETFTVLNRPSDGNVRAVNNCVFLVSTAPATGELDSFYVEPACGVVLTGARTAVTAVPVDANGYAVDEFGRMRWTSDGGVVEYDETGGEVFIAGSQPGVFDLTASAMGSSGSAPIRVVDGLSRLTVTRCDTGNAAVSLTLAPGDTVDLDPAGTWYNLAVAMDDSDVIWAADSAIGSIDENGVFTAGPENAEGTITVTAGGRTAEVSVKVDRGDPFTDIATHWSQTYVTQLYKMGVTTGTVQPDGTYVYQPDSELRRGDLLVFLTRLLGVDTSLYAGVELPFADNDAIPDWMLPEVKAMYALQVLGGTVIDGQLYADVNGPVSRETAMTLLGRVLTEQYPCDLSAFADGDQVSGWALTYVQTLVYQGVISGSDGYLNPKTNVTRGEIAKILLLFNDLPREELAPQL